MRILVQSGGASKGAFSAGVLKHLIGDLKIKYDAYCGISVGAINSAFMAQFPIGEEKESVQALCDMWLTIDNSKIYKSWWPFGKLHALWNKSVYDSQPLHDLIRSNIDLNKIRLAGNKVCVGTVSMNTGKYTIFDQDSDHFIEAIIGSSAFPGFLKPVEFLDQTWSDGGVKEQGMLKKAVEMGANTIDLIITSPETRISRFIKNPISIDILRRSLDLSTDKIMANDIDKILMYNKLAKAGDSDYRFIKLNIIRPKFNLIEDLLDFSPSKIKVMMDKGYESAMEAVETNNF